MARPHPAMPLLGEAALAERSERDARAVARARRDAANRNLIVKTLITSVVLVLLLLYLMPMGYSIVTSLSSKDHVSDVRAPVLPSARVQFEYQGQSFDVVKVPVDGETRELALVRRGRAVSAFVDPENPAAGEIEWEGAWRALQPAYELDVRWENYPRAFRFINFAQLLRNTLMYAVITTIAATSSAAIVAYGFARFRFPFKGILFMLLISTIILPPQATLVPQYAVFFRLGWVGTWLPLIIPTFFANAYNVFLLRQYFLTIPTELEEAARVDGAGPIRTFVSVILPQAVPALIAVSLFHFFFAWNDFFGPLIYLAGSQDLLPISVGLFRFNGLYSSEPQLIQAASIMTMLIPLTIFFFAQRFFLQGVVITGVDK
ncbi:MAG: carbohydrate ABC transporter permease [Trueperaceae bacterium]